MSLQERVVGILLEAIEENEEGPRGVGEMVRNGVPGDS